MYEAKPLFEERMKKLLKDKQDYDNFINILKKETRDIIRCNTIKISPEKLKSKLERKSWKISQPYSSNKEIMIIENDLPPGDLGNSEEHLNGEYYVQELSSIMSPIALSPKEHEIIIDLCASPGSKTTQISAYMNNKGTIIANDNDLGRTHILNRNLSRCSCMNVIVTKNDNVQLCKKLEKANARFDRILLDAPCSGEGILRTNNETFLSWNIKTIEKLSNMQKKMIAAAIPLLKQGGILVYSTCTHAPEENEEIINFALKNFNVEIEKVNLPIKTREGITSWNNEKFDEKIKLCHRIYPQDNDSEGFFVAKLKKK
jgi:NOL1/NOP2/sun family putative RNA methylase